MKINNDLSVLIQAFFTDYLISQRQASQHTIASYRDTFRLFLQFIQKYLKKEPSAVKINDITVSLIKSFLTNLDCDSDSRKRVNYPYQVILRKTTSFDRSQEHGGYGTGNWRFYKQIQ